RPAHRGGAIPPPPPGLGRTRPARVHSYVLERESPECEGATRRPATMVRLNCAGGPPLCPPRISVLIFLSFSRFWTAQTAPASGKIAGRGYVHPYTTGPRP